MPTFQMRSGRFAGFSLALLLASFAVTSCGEDIVGSSDPGQAGEVEPATEPSVLNPGACAAVARDGKVDICHANPQAAVLHEALTVPTESCGTTHALHQDDFLADPDIGCLKAAKKCKGAGKRCKIGRPGDCCNICLCLEGQKCECT